jgi:hypothetical protein
MFVLCWIFFDFNDIRLMCRNFFHVCGDRMRRRQCVHRRVGAASYLYLQRWLRLYIRYEHYMRGEHDDVPRLRCWVQLHGKWRAGNCVLLFAWVCIDIYDVKRVRHDIGYMSDDWLRCRQCVRRRDVAANRVHMQPRLLLHINYHHRVRG